MPAYQPQSNNLLQVLLGRAKQPEVHPSHNTPDVADFAVGSPMTTVAQELGGLAMPGAKNGLSMLTRKNIFRGSGDVAKFLTPEVEIPSALDMGSISGKVEGALADYSHKIQQLLGHKP